MDEYAGSIFEPVSLHKYLYANANPVTYCDPTGYMSLGQLIGNMAIGAIIGSIVTATFSGIFSALISGLKGGNARDILDAFYDGFEAGKYTGIALGALGALASEYIAARYILFAFDAIFAGVSVRSGSRDLEDGYIEAGALEVGLGLLLVFSSIRNALIGAKMQAASAKSKLNINNNKVIETASVEKKGGETIAGHALQKHAGRNPDVWGKISGNSEKINKTALKHIKDILEGTGDFNVTKAPNGSYFLEKFLKDGRGIRLNMDGSFKGFIDQR